MSPTQKLGALPLTANDINRFSRVEGKASLDYALEDVGPALTMMRAQDQEHTHRHTPSAASAAFASSDSETLFTASPSPYQTSFASAPDTKPPSPFGGMAPPKNAMSPDDMLKAYAAERKAVSTDVKPAKIVNPSPLARSFSPEADNDASQSTHAM